MIVIQLIWKCKKCGDILVSRSDKRHDMNVCKCGQSGVDLEQWYQRNMGSIEPLNEKKIEDGKIIENITYDQRTEE